MPMHPGCTCQGQFGWVELDEHDNMRPPSASTSTLIVKRPAAITATTFPISYPLPPLNTRMRSSALHAHAPNSNMLPTPLATRTPASNASADTHTMRTLSLEPRGFVFVNEDLRRCERSSTSSSGFNCCAAADHAPTVDSTAARSVTHVDSTAVDSTAVDSTAAPSVAHIDVRSSYVRADAAIPAHGVRCNAVVSDGAGFNAASLEPTHLRRLDGCHEEAAAAAGVIARRTAARKEPIPCGKKNTGSKLKAAKVAASSSAASSSAVSSSSSAISRPGRKATPRKLHGYGVFIPFYASHSKEDPRWEPRLPYPSVDSLDVDTGGYILRTTHVAAFAQRLIDLGYGFRIDLEGDDALPGKLWKSFLRLIDIFFRHAGHKLCSTAGRLNPSAPLVNIVHVRGPRSSGRFCPLPRDCGAVLVEDLKEYPVPYADGEFYVLFEPVATFMYVASPMLKTPSAKGDPVLRMPNGLHHCRAVSTFDMVQDLNTAEPAVVHGRCPQICGAMPKVLPSSWFVDLLSEDAPASTPSFPGTSHSMFDPSPPTPGLRTDMEGVVFTNAGSSYLDQDADDFLGGRYPPAGHPHVARGEFAIPGASSSASTSTWPHGVAAGGSQWSSSVSRTWPAEEQEIRPFEDLAGGVSFAINSFPDAVVKAASRALAASVAPERVTGAGAPVSSSQTAMPQSRSRSTVQRPFPPMSPSPPASRAAPTPPNNQFLYAALNIFPPPFAVSPTASSAPVVDAADPFGGDDLLAQLAADTFAPPDGLVFHVTAGPEPMQDAASTPSNHAAETAPSQSGDMESLHDSDSEEDDDDDDAVVDEDDFLVPEPTGVNYTAELPGTCQGPAKTAMNQERKKKMITTKLMITL
ncbi:hypothetical protein AURDEDRAFT_167832 [Auricularia subglabra TFB-10046 SS5]|nr:hypothetical protein AURDEDRAFT_167832 [Auricularia subglabra TFB-10046 SS5]